ncbi:MAG: hypothetical protein WDO19_22905 [Bacteroidota bacterium]
MVWAGTSNTDELVWINTNTLTYNKKFAGDQSVEAVIGTEARKSASTRSYMDAKNYGNSIVTTLNNASQIVDFGSAKSQWAFFSYFARAIYNYADRYIFSGAFRADGSSRFPAANRTANFYSFSGAWRISSEQFMKGQDIFQRPEIKGKLWYQRKCRIRVILITSLLMDRVQIIPSMTRYLPGHTLRGLKMTISNGKKRSS